MAIPIPPLAPHEGSWVVVDKRDGLAVCEIFKNERKRINWCARHGKPDRVEIVTIGTWLARVNEKAKAQ